MDSFRNFFRRHRNLDFHASETVFRDGDRLNFEVNNESKEFDFINDFNDLLNVFSGLSAIGRPRLIRRSERGSRANEDDKGLQTINR